MVVRKIDQENDGRLNHGFFKVVMHIACNAEGGEKLLRSLGIIIVSQVACVTQRGVHANPT
jgi:hypothetical protein